MYIYEVIEKADRLCPNQFDDSEKTAWLDELGAMLETEYRKDYGVWRTAYSKDGVKLPEGVTREDVRRVFVRGIPLPRLALVCRGDRYVIQGAFEGDEAMVVYQKRYVPIEDIAEAVTVCGAPYDAMYVEWLLAKMYFYNRDTEGYNQHTASFNNMLTSYRNYLKYSAEIDKSAKIVGWI